MDRAEEACTDAVALMLVREMSFSFMVRGLIVSFGNGHRVEYDLLGIHVVGDRIECVEGFETKLRCNVHDRRSALRKQLEDRRRTEMFRRLWAIWDVDKPATTERYAGYGTLLVQNGPAAHQSSVSPRKQCEAPALPVRDTAQGRALYAALVQFLPPWIATERPAAVYMMCPECRGHTQYFYPFTVDVLNSATTVGTDEHAFFCTRNPNQQRHFAFGSVSYSKYTEGRWDASATTVQLARKW